LHLEPLEKSTLFQGVWINYFHKCIM
jgi:hypothetical protein